MPQHIKTAADWHNEFRSPAARKSKEKRDKSKRDMPSVEDLRDDCLGLIKQNRMSFQQVEDEGGPVVSTLVKWDEGKTKRPHMDTVPPPPAPAGMTLNS